MALFCCIFTRLWLVKIRPHTRAIFFLYIGLLEMTQLTRKPPIALRLILRGSCSQGEETVAMRGLLWQ